MCVFLIMTQSKNIFRRSVTFTRRNDGTKCDILSFKTVFFSFHSSFSDTFEYNLNYSSSVEDYFPLTNKEQTAANNIFKTFISYQCCSLADKLAF